MKTKYLVQFNLDKKLSFEQPITMHWSDLMLTLSILKRDGSKSGFGLHTGNWNNVNIFEIDKNNEHELLRTNMTNF